MTEVLRYDYAPIQSWERTDEGYLRVWARTARTGVQTYYKKDGTPVREYRPEEEVAKPESLQTFGMKPVTWGHPPVLLDSANTNQFQIGHAGSQVRYNDGFVEVALLITDEDKINRILRKDAQECSAGYRVDADETPGVTPEGESYDIIQRNIKVNHIAIVPRGRAGNKVRLLMDSADGSGVLSFNQEPPLNPTMAVVHLDGLQIEIPTEAATAVQSYVQKLRADSDTLKTQLEEAQSELRTAEEEKETLEGRIDALEEELNEIQENQDGEFDISRIDAAQLDQLVAERLDMLERLAPAFDENFAFDGIGEEDLYNEAFKNIFGQSPDEDTDFGYIKGMVDGALAAQTKEDSADDRNDQAAEASTTKSGKRTDSANAATAKVMGGLKQVESKQTRADEARAERTKATRSRWQKPMRATQAA